MFRNPNMSQVETLSGVMRDEVSLNAMTPLARACYRELTPNEPDTIEDLLAFYQNDKGHEDLMDDLSTEIARGINGIIGKVQNELLDLVDTTFEEVKKKTSSNVNEVITHKLMIVPEIKFLDSTQCEEVAGTNIDSRARLEVKKSNGTKFNERTSHELLNRISKTMSADSFALFAEMVRDLKIDVSEIYDNTIRGLDHNYKPLAAMGPLYLPYTYLEAIVGYHIAKALMDEPDDETRLSEIEYNEYISAKVNNLLIRYADAQSMILKSLENSLNSLLWFKTSQIFEIKLYAPALEKMEAQLEVDRNRAIEIILSQAVVNSQGRYKGVHEHDQYQKYRQEVLTKNALNMSSATTRALTQSFEEFIDSRHFDTWYSSNVDGVLTQTIRNTYLSKVRDIISSSSVGSDDELYNLIISIVCESFYDRPGIKQFVNDIRIAMASGDITVHEAVGLASDRLIAKYLVEMISV